MKTTIPISASRPWGAVLMLLAVAAALAPTPAQATSYWSETYGGPGGYEQVLNLRQMPDNSIIVAGTTDSFGTMTGDAWWILLDADGAVLDERVHGNSLPGAAAAVALDADGGMAVVGAHTLDIFSDRDAWAHHVDAAGNIDWAVNFDAPGMHAFYAVAPAGDGGYIASGSTAESDMPPFSAWAVKLDGNGGVTWQKRYHGGLAEHANFVVQTQDGGYAIAGWTTSSGAGMTDVWLLKIDGNGLIQWQRTYGGFDQEEATGLIQTADGGFALSAVTHTWTAAGMAAWVLRLDAGGDLLWHAVFEDAWSDFRGIVQTADGNLLATGRIAGPASNDLWAVKLRESDGGVIWQRAYEGDTGDWGNMSIELADSGLLIGGIWGYGFAQEDIWLQRTAADGQIPNCPLIRETDQESRSPIVTVQNGIAVAFAAAPLPEPIAFVSNPSSLTVDEKCRHATGVIDASDAGFRSQRISVAPNPIRSSATISFRLEREARARIDLYDVSGRHLETLAEGLYQAGLQRLSWNEAEIGRLPAGAYFIALDLEGERHSLRVIVLR